MIRHVELKDPVKRTDEMPVQAFQKYVDIRKQQTGDTDPEIVAEIKQRFYGAHLGFTDEERLDDMWGFIEPKIVKNAGLAQFILDYKGAESKYFFPWLMTVFTSPAKALEMSYGAGYNLWGEWANNILQSGDPIVYFIENDPTFVYNRERQLYVADLATTIHDQAYDLGARSKVIDLGAGMLAWARWHGYEFDGHYQVIYAYDKDPTIQPETLFEDTYGLAEVHYRQENLFDALKNPESRNANLIILGGVASYMDLRTFTERVIEPVYKLLDVGGVFFFDLQVDCPYLQRSMNIFDWPAMYLPGSATEAIQMVEDVRKTLWGSNLKFSAEYAVDTYNANPSAVMVTLEKLE